MIPKIEMQQSLSKQKEVIDAYEKLIRAAKRKVDLLSGIIREIDDSEDLYEVARLNLEIIEKTHALNAKKRAYADLEKHFAAWEKKFAIDDVEVQKGWDSLITKARVLSTTHADSHADRRSQNNVVLILSKMDSELDKVMSDPELKHRYYFSLKQDV